MAIRKVSLPGWKSFTLYTIRSAVKVPGIILVGKQLRKIHGKNDDECTSSLVAYIVASAIFGLGMITSLLVNSDD